MPIPTEQYPTWVHLQSLNAEIRMAKFLLLAGGDEAAAIELWLLNTALSAEFWKLIGPFEVALRNLIDNQLNGSAFAGNGALGWIEQLADLHGARDSKIAGDIALARRRVQQNGKVATRDQMISELPFGFWHLMVSKKMRAYWPTISRGFKSLPSRNPDGLERKIARVRKLRNRIGHHHEIVSRDLRLMNADLITLTYWIDPQLSDWLRSNTEVAELIERCERLISAGSIRAS